MEYTQHRVAPGSAPNLAEISTRGSDLYEGDRESAEAEFEALREELADWQHRFYAEGKHKLLIVLQALDAGGKDGTIRRVFQGVNPQGVRVTSFKAPTALELSHDYLWRIHQNVPATGMWGIFNRSHYEDVLIVRVLNLVPPDQWQLRYDHINQFERLLGDTGTVILKFFLHISPEEQRERLQARLDDPKSLWKFDKNDLKQRVLWSHYTEAFEAVFAQTSTPCAPWHIIPADQKWYRNLAVARVLVGTLRDLNPQFPPAVEGLEGLVIPPL